MSRFDVLRESRLFADCTEPELLQLNGLAHDRELEDGELVFAYGDAARELILVVAGEVRLELPVSVLGGSKSIPFESKKRGEVLGWSALVPPYRYTLSARAAGKATITGLAARELTARAAADPTLGVRVMRNLAVIIAQRLQHTQSMWIREVQRDLEERYR